MVLHYSDGYGGNYNYVTYCGRVIHSHCTTERTTLDPNKVTCPHCKESTQYKEDLAEPKDVKHRLFLESDFVTATDLYHAQTMVRRICRRKKEPYVRRVFSEIMEHAWLDLATTWEAVKRADEIYADSSLIPLSGNSYMGAPVIFNGMCEHAVKENITGKDVYILRRLGDINWYMIDLKLMVQAFKENRLFMMDEDYDGLIQVDVVSVAKKQKR